MQKSKKIVILGHFGVGKTSMVRRFVENTFSEDYLVTIGVHISKKVVEISAGESISMILWDLEGTDDIESIRKAYLMGSSGVLFVFDVSRPSTFQNIINDLELVAQKTQQIPLLIIANKMDLVNEEDLDKILTNKNISYDFLVSAKTGNNVEEAFAKMAHMVK